VAAQTHLTTTLADSETTSGAISVPDNYEIAGFVFDAGLDGTAVTFLAGTTYVAVEDDSSTAVSITAEASKVSMLTTAAKVAAIAPLKDFKIVIGTPQTGSTTIRILLRRVA